MRLKPQDTKKTITLETKKHLKSGSDLIVSYSGGKDSTAVCLRLFELGYTKEDFTRVFFDTGWESPETYNYLNRIENIIGPIDRVKTKIDISEMHPAVREKLLDFESELGYESPFLRKAFRVLMWPTHFRKWCTTDLKLNAYKKYLNDRNNDFISVVGVRRAESRSRANVLEWEWNDGFDSYIWRPLYLWDEEDVIKIHNRFGVIPNQLYLNGHSRVGCFPCIYANKSDIKNLPEYRIDFILRVEKAIGDLMIKHKDLKPNLKEQMEKDKKNKGYYFRSFFGSRKAGLSAPIDELFEWSKTVRGGKQLMLFDTEEPSCAKWGLCSFTGNRAQKFK